MVPDILNDSFVGPWWCVQRSHPYSSEGQIAVDVATLRHMEFNGVLLCDDDLRQYLWGLTNDSDPSQYRSALIAQECRKNGMMFMFAFDPPKDELRNTDVDSFSFRSSFGPRLQVIANYFKQFSNFRGFLFDDWAEIGRQVDNYDEWDCWLRNQFKTERPYWIGYDDSYRIATRELLTGLFKKITQSYTVTGCYYSQTFDPSWIDDFAARFPWETYADHQLALFVSSWRYSDAPSQWSPDTIRPWIQRALRYPCFKTFIYFGWRLSSPNEDYGWSNALSQHPEWWGAIAQINSLVTSGRIFHTCTHVLSTRQTLLGRARYWFAPFL